jgi:hypothetical protein
VSAWAVLATTGGWLESPAGIVQGLLGAVLLLFGRRLFWLLVAAVGFVAGLWLAEAYLPMDSEALRWLVGLLVGVLAALAAIFLQRFAVALGGALVAGYGAHWYLSLGGDGLENWQWALVVGAAVAGLLIARHVFDFGLIFFSSIAGATLILESLPVEASTSRWLFLVLVVLGAFVQASMLPGKKAKG